VCVLRFSVMSMRAQNVLAAWIWAAVGKVLILGGFISVASLGLFLSSSML